MAGDKKKRFCAECDKFVYDFSQMTRRQIEAIVSIHRGRLCAQITRRRDGSLLTMETPPVHPVAARRASPVASAALAVILGVSVPGIAMNADAYAAQIAVRSNSDSEGSKTPHGGGEAVIGGVVLDEQRGVIPNAVVKFISDAGAELKTVTSADGEFNFAKVPFGAYIMLVEADGFFTYVNSSIIVDTPYDLGFEVSMKANHPTITLGGAIGMAAPSSLLDLYQESNLIAIAYAGRSVVDGIDDEMNTKRIKTELRISERIKDDAGRKVITYYHWVYENFPPQFNQGDKLLVLLRPYKSDDGKQPGGYQSAGWGNGVKKLDDGALAIYRQRIEELETIFQSGDPNPAEIVEWLIRCVQEPATREEGVSKLSNILTVAPSLSYSEDENEFQLDEIEETADQPEAAGEDADDFDVAKWRKETRKLAAALTQDHKARLADALFGIAELSENDIELVNMIRNFEDERLAPYLVAQLRSMADRAPRLAGSLVWIIAEIIKDEDLNRLANDYNEAAKFDKSEEDGKSDRLDSTRNPGADGLTVAAIKRSALLKDFLKLIDYKAQRKMYNDSQPGVQ